jgi:hypothetical protein
MSFSLPNFNLEGKFYQSGLIPGVDPPSINLPCQLYLLSRLSQDITPGETFVWVPPLIVRTSVELIRFASGGWVGGYVSIVDTTTGRPNIYYIRWWEACHMGFTNEYIAVLVEQTDPELNLPPTDR